MAEAVGRAGLGKTPPDPCCPEGLTRSGGGSAGAGGWGRGGPRSVCHLFSFLSYRC